MGFEKQLKSEQLYKGKILNLWRDTVELEDGKHSTREVVESAGGSSILAVDKSEQIYLVHQFRYPYKQSLLEIPAGKVEKGEDPKLTALRELKEECGLIACDLQFLGKLYPTVAYCTEIIYIYLAEDCIISDQTLDDGEFIDIIKMPFEKAYRMVLNGDICDAKTQIAILKYAELKRIRKLKDL